jgi:hypothetical protein
MKMDLNKNSVIEGTVCIHVAQIRLEDWAYENGSEQKLCDREDCMYSCSSN